MFSLPSWIRTLAQGFRSRTRPIVRLPVRLAAEILENRIVPNSAPIAGWGSYSTNHDVAVVDVDLQSYISDADNDPFTVVIVDGPSHGTLTQQQNGKFTYTPDVQFTGLDWIMFAGDDGIDVGIAAGMYFYVNNTGPAASWTSIASIHDRSVTDIDLNALITDAEDDPFEITITNGPQFGTLTLQPNGKYTYTPNAGFTGADGFTYEASDGMNTGPGAGVTIYVNNNAPSAGDLGTLFGHPNGDLAVSAPAGLFSTSTDTDGDVLTATIVSGPSHGAVILGSAGAFTYTPNTDYTGLDTFVYVVNDGIADSAPATVTLCIWPVTPADLYAAYLADVDATNADYLIAVADRDAAILAARAAAQEDADELYADYETAVALAQATYDDAIAAAEADYQAALATADAAWESATADARAMYDSPYVIAKEVYDAVTAALEVEYEQSLTAADLAFDVAIAPYVSARDGAYDAWQSDLEDPELEAAYLTALAALESATTNAELARDAAYTTAIAAYETGMQTAESDLNIVVCAYRAAVEPANVIWRSSEESAWGIFSAAKLTSAAAFLAAEESAWNDASSELATINANLAATASTINASHGSAILTGSSAWQTAESFAWQAYEQMLGMLPAATTADARVTAPPESAVGTVQFFPLSLALVVNQSSSSSSTNTGPIVPTEIVRIPMPDGGPDSVGMRADPRRVEEFQRIVEAFQSGPESRIQQIQYQGWRSTLSEADRLLVQQIELQRALALRQIAAQRRSDALAQTQFRSPSAAELRLTERLRRQEEEGADLARLATHGPLRSPANFQLGRTREWQELQEANDRSLYHLSTVISMLPGGQPMAFIPVIMDFGEGNYGTALLTTLTVGYSGYAQLASSARALQGVELAAAQRTIGLRVLNQACFVAGTPILTTDGEIPIERLKIGDSVVSRSEHDAEGPLAIKAVEATFTRTSPVLNLRVRGQTICTTPEHPFFVRGKGWTIAHDLKRGDRLSSHDGQWVAVEAVEDLNETATVYNLRVSDYHTYFVGSREWGFSIWAHNSICGEEVRRLITPFVGETAARNLSAQALENIAAALSRQGGQAEAATLLRTATGLSQETATILSNSFSQVAGRQMANIGSKLEYLFGRATGSQHNIERSLDMLRQMERIGLPDNPANRTLATEFFQNMLKGTNNIVRVQENGRVVRQALLMGPRGGVAVEAVWEGDRLITFVLTGG